MKRMLLVGLIIGILLTTAAKAEEVKGTIQGSIINGTDPQKNISGQEIILYRAQGEKTLPRMTAETNPQGKYVFEGLATESEYKYQVSTTYLEVPYFTDLITFESGRDKVQTIDLRVFDITDNPDHLRVQREHMVLDATDNELSVNSIAIIENTGSKTFWIKGKTAGLRFPLPDGFSDFRGFGKVIKDPDNPNQSAYIYTDPVSPGIRQVFFAYKLDFRGLQRSIVKRFFYLTPQLDLFLADRGLQLNGQGLTFRGYQDMGQKRFLVWMGKDFKPGTSLNIGITGSQPLIYGVYKGIGYGFVIVLIITGFSYPLVRSRFFSAPGDIKDSPKRKETMKNLRKEKMKRLRIIAELDDKFDAGQISEDEYRGLREENKQALIRIARHLKEHEE